MDRMDQPKNSVDPINTGNKVIPIKTKSKADRKPEPQKRPDLPKQPQQKITIRRDAPLKKKKKKKEPFSYKYLRRKARSVWYDNWEIIFTIILAIFFALFILPRFLQ